MFRGSKVNDLNYYDAQAFLVFSCCGQKYCNYAGSKQHPVSQNGPAACYSRCVCVCPILAV